MPFRLEVSFRGRPYDVQIDESEPTFESLGKAIEHKTGAAFETLKLIAPKLKRSLHVSSHKDEFVERLGLENGARVLLVASTEAEVNQLRAQKDDPTIIGFEDELKRAALRYQGKSRPSVSPKLPSGPYTFQSFEAWDRAGLSPPPSEALTLLHRLAADPGIVGVMERHGWAVGLMSEMPPEGKVGISAVCILGFNRNRGMEISLRLRTDDLRGFRKYERIRETLVHELAHMVHDEHDSNFKALNSQLLRECAELDWRSPGGRLLVAAAAESEEAASSLEGYVDERDVMAATAALSGRALGRGHEGEAPAAASPREAAAAAALRRLEHFTHAASASTLADLPSTSGASLYQPGQLDHMDPGTQAAEAAMRRLGTFDQSDMDAAVADMQLADGGEVMRDPQHADGGAAHVGASHGGVDGPRAGTGEGEAPGTSGAGPLGASSQPEQGARPQPEVQALPGGNVSHTSAVDAQPDGEPMQVDGPEGSSSTTRDAAGEGGAPAALTRAQPAVPAESVLAEVVAAMGELQARLPADDPVAQKFRQLEGAVAKLLRSCTAPDALLALETLSSILRNVLEHPSEDRYRRVRQGNATFQRKAGRWPGTQEVLTLAGFAAESDQGPEAVLVFRRNDPGLLWLVSSGLQIACDQLRDVAT